MKDKKIMGWDEKTESGSRNANEVEKMVVEPPSANVAVAVNSGTFETSCKIKI